MDLFQRLLGTLQQTVDYISTFTTYLLGNESHPGAEGSGSTGETVPHRSHHEHEEETAHLGDISSTSNPEAFKVPPIAEIIPPNWEIQEASGKNFSCAQVAEPILRPSKLPCKYEGEEDVGRRLSEAANFLAGTPKPRSITTGSLQKRDLEGPSVPGGLHQWEPEGRARVGAVQQELLEETADVNDWKREKPLAGGQEQEELGGSVEAEGLRQKGEETEGGEQEAPGGAESEGEERRGLDGAAWAGGFQQEVARVAKGQQPEADRHLVGGIKMEDNLQKEPDIEAENEGVQKAVPDGAETGGDQQGGQGGKAEAKGSLQWEPEETVTLDVQEEDPKRVAEKRDSQQRGLEGAEGLEGSVGNGGTLQREREENEGDEQAPTVVDESVMEELMGDERAWAGKFQEEVARVVEAHWLEAEGQLVGRAEAENYPQWEPDMEAEGARKAVPGVAEARADQQARLEAEAGRKLQWEPEETLEQHPEKGNRLLQGLQGAEEREGHQQGELEGLVRGVVATEEQEWKEPLGEAVLETDQRTLVGTTALEEEVVAAGLADPDFQGQEPGGMERSLLPEPMGCHVPLDADCLAGAGTFPHEVPSLDTSAQKERVLLRRKSSIRRAPSLKRPRPPVQTPPLETDVADNSPSQPPAFSRPNLRPAGFGPVHPNMMAELQMRLRRPQ